MKKAEREKFLHKLQVLRSRITGEVQHLTDEAFSHSNSESTQPNHMAELGSDVYEQDVTLMMIQSEGNALTEINDAIVRYQNGTFGKCEICDKPIPMARLEAIPYARCCVDCARTAEQRR